jgi:hypothetical protein
LYSTLESTTFEVMGYNLPIGIQQRNHRP